MTTVIVLAKECVPGRVKTRLTPPFTPDEAAALAAASLQDTLDAASMVRADRHLLWFDGAAPRGTGFEIGRQPEGGLDERLAAVFGAVDDRAVLVGMDTPQLDPAILQAVLDDDSGADAWFGRAHDGGFWALGLDPRPRRGDLIRGVPMSTAHTGAAQMLRLTTAGLHVRPLPALTDVDHAEEARQVAAEAPWTRFAALLDELGSARRSAA